MENDPEYRKQVKEKRRIESNAKARQVYKELSQDPEWRRRRREKRKTKNMSPEQHT